MSRIIAMFLLISQACFSQEVGSEGIIIYKIDEVTPLDYKDEYITKFPEDYKKSLRLDSITQTLTMRLKFKDGLSQLEITDDITSRNSEIADAMVTIDAQGIYYYDTKSEMSTSLAEIYAQYLTIDISMKDKWQIDYSKTKIIDGRKCFYALYTGKDYIWDDEGINAWFTPEIPLRYGPLYFNGLPGLIVELNRERFRYTATKINLNEKVETIILPTSDASDRMTEEYFRENRIDIKNKGKRLLRNGK